jgi:hypothetical protein
MWVLRLNDIRYPDRNHLESVVKAASKEALVGLLERERVLSYVEDGKPKYFRKGGPLEWFHEPRSYDEQHFIDVDAWANDVRKQREAWIEGHKAKLLSCPEVGS